MNALELAEVKKQISLLAGLPSTHFDTLAIEGNTVLIDKFPYSEDFVPPFLNGGWGCIYSGPLYVGSIGKIVLVPKREDTRELWREGQVQFAMRRGLTYEQAVRWLASRLPVKHSLIDLLAAVLKRNDINEISDYMSYDISFTPSVYNDWKSRTGITEPAYPKALASFTELLKEVLYDETETPEVKPIITNPDNNTPVVRVWDLPNAVKK